MKPARKNPLLPLCLVVLAVFSGCARKKPVTALPQPPAPSVAAPQATPEPVPAEAQPQAQASQTPTQGTPPPDQQPAQLSEEKTEEKADAAKAKKPRATGKKTEARNVPPKTVVKPDGAEGISPPGQISPGLSHAEIAQAQATTEQLLQSTEATLNGLKRQLSQDEQAIVTQIRDFMAQSRQATKENDLVRAHNLAVKANLLSDELAKRR
jgi:hypothetical protein